jgi:hypothetical protein
MGWLRRRTARRVLGPGSADRAPGAGRPLGPVDRLGVDGVPIPVRTRYEEFEKDVRDSRIAFLRAGFGKVRAGAGDDPMFRMATWDVGYEAYKTSLCCLMCFSRYRVSALHAGTLAGGRPITCCQVCGCPDAVLFYDPAVADIEGRPRDLRRLDGVGRRVERAFILYGSTEPGPDTVGQAIDLASSGASVEGAVITTVPVPESAADHADTEEVALALVVRDEADRRVSPGAAERIRLTWLNFPEHGHLLVAQVVAPD